jgi:hypothetical protein
MSNPPPPSRLPPIIINELLMGVDKSLPIQPDPAQHRLALLARAGKIADNPAVLIQESLWHPRNLLYGHCAPVLLTHPIERGTKQIEGARFSRQYNKLKQGLHTKLHLHMTPTHELVGKGWPIVCCKATPTP